MSINRFLRLGALVMTAVAVGCATTSTGTKSSRAAQSSEPKTEPAGEQQAAVEEPRSATELLREAEEAFRTANAAQERGDYEAALRHYNQMLELLVKADLDPSIFYNLRTEFEKILGGTDTQHARLFDPNDPNWASKVVAPQGLAPMGPTAINLDIPESLALRVQTEIQEIQEVYPRNFQYGLNRSTKYLPYVLTEFRKAKLPDDLVWLAMVESQFTPKINSPAGAGGMWQFMRATGARYGLRIDDYVDERYNWEKSTQAAIAYLTDLNGRFGGEWPLAVSAYNMGEGGMERAVAANKGERELVKLIEQPPASNILRTETKKFYPKLLASIIVAKNPEKYGFTLEVQQPDNYVRVPVRGCYSLAALDSACSLPEGTLRRLNPDLVKGVTPPSGEYQVAVPTEAQQLFVASLQNLPQERHRSIFSRLTDGGESKSASRSTSSSSKGQVSGNRTHKVRKGETLSSIASKYGVNVQELAKANKMRTTHALMAGKKLVIPGSAEVSAPAESPASAEPKKADEPAAVPVADSGRTYKVRSGDTLFEIAKREGCSIDDLRTLNGVKGKELKVGDTLKLSPAANASSKAQAAAPSGEKVEHTVKAGETPAKIASRYGVKVDDLVKWNSIKNGTIFKDQKLSLYCSASGAASAPAADASPKATTHKVKSGETASVIADRYDVALSDLLAWNNLKKTSTLRLGQELVIKGGGSLKAAGTPAKSGARETVHEVKAGQNPSSIASKYGVKVSDLFKWNGWSKNHTLQVGERVVIKK